MSAVVKNDNVVMLLSSNKESPVVIKLLLSTLRSMFGTLCKAAVASIIRGTVQVRCFGDKVKDVKSDV